MPIIWIQLVPGNCSYCFILFIYYIAYIIVYIVLLIRVKTFIYIYKGGNVVGYSDHSLTLLRLTIKFTLNHRLELATSWPESAIGVLEDPGHIETQAK